MATEKQIATKRKLALIFSQGPKPRLVKTSLNGSVRDVPEKGFGWGKQAISFCFRLVDYHICGTPPEKPQSFEEREPDIADSFWHVCSASSAEFVAVFGNRASFNKIFRCTGKHGKKRVEIVQTELAPDDVEIQRVTGPVPVGELKDFAESIKIQLPPSKQDRQPPWPWRRWIARPILSDEPVKPSADSCAFWLTLGLQEWFGTDRGFTNIVRQAKAWLKEHPEDILTRAIYLWAILIRGNPKQMVEVIKETVTWLEDGQEGRSGYNALGGTDNQREALHLIVSSNLPARTLLEAHLEDGLVRAALLRWLKHDEKSSQLAKAVGEIKGLLRMNTFVKTVLRLTKHLWLPRKSKYKLLRVAQLWLAGRPSHSIKKARKVIEENKQWLEQHPDETLVRTVLIWLTGFRGTAEQIDELLDQSGTWLKMEKQQNECLVRTAFLWWVGAKGTPSHVDETVEQTVRWLNKHPDDGFVRIAYLLFVIKRRGNTDQTTSALNETATWLKSHPDDLVSFAVDFVRCVRGME